MSQFNEEMVAGIREDGNIDLPEVRQMVDAIFADGTVDADELKMFNELVADVESGDIMVDDDAEDEWDDLVARITEATNNG